MPLRDLLLTDVKFVYQAKVTRRRARKPTSSAYMATAHVEVGVVGRSETHVAYSVEPGRGRPAFQIVAYGGRLYWPALGDLGGRPGTTETRLRRLLSWRWDIDAADLSKPTHMEPPSLDADLSWRSIEASGESEALALLHRRAAACLVVDGEVLAEGGVPVAPRSPRFNSRNYPTLSGGTSRALDPGANGLGWQPGAFHLRETQLYLGAGRFSVPSPTDQIGGITTHCAFPIDPIEIRIDATFRVAWHQFRAVAKKRQAGALSEVVNRFSAAEAAPAELLTSRRWEALRFMMETGGSLGIRTELLRFIAATMEAARSGAGAMPGYDLTEEDIEFLAVLAQ